MSQEIEEYEVKEKGVEIKNVGFSYLSVSICHT